MQEETNETEIIIKPCNLTGLAAAYGIHRKTLRKCLAPHQDKIGKREGYVYSLEQVLVIIDVLGIPPKSIK